LPGWLPLADARSPASSGVLAVGAGYAPRGGCMRRQAAAAPGGVGKPQQPGHPLVAISNPPPSLPSSRPKRTATPLAKGKTIMTSLRFKIMRFRKIRTEIYSFFEAEEQTLLRVRILNH